MKKLLTVGILLTGLIFLSNTNLYAQEAGDMSIGGGLAYGTDVENLGIQASGTYVLQEDMRLGADIIYWLMGSDDFGAGYELSYTFLEINANYNYIFHNEDDLMVYALGTLGIHYAKADYDGPGSEYGDDYSDTELGLGVGVGLEYDLGSVTFYAEPRIFLSGFDQFSLAAGVRVPIN